MKEHYSVSLEEKNEDLIEAWGFSDYEEAKNKYKELTIKYPDKYIYFIKVLGKSLNGKKEDYGQ